MVLFTNAEEITVKCHFYMMFAICVKKDVFILTLGPIYKNHLLVISSFSHNIPSYDIVERGKYLIFSPYILILEKYIFQN